MKRKLSHVFVVLLAAFIGYAASGVNVFQYCCEACENHGNGYFTYVSCDDVHSLNDCQCSTAGSLEGDVAQESSNDGAEKYITNALGEDLCDLLRLELDLFTPEYESSTSSVELVSFDLIFPLDNTFLTSCFTEDFSVTISEYQLYKPSSRYLLCLNSTFII